jgi:hypothetical protein
MRDTRTLSRRLAGNPQGVYLEDREGYEKNVDEIDCVEEGHRVNGIYSCSCPVVVDVQPSG